jgi:hypothetical protein
MREKTVAEGQAQKQPRGVIVRLDRTIQYSRDVRGLTEKPLEYWMPRLRGA